MEPKKGLCLLLLGLLAYSSLSKCNICLPAEEGSEHRIVCEFPPSFRIFQNLTWEKSNSTVVTCIFQQLRGYSCKETFPEIIAEINDSSILRSSLIFKNVSRSRPPTIETSWSCIETSFESGTPSKVCDPLQVYAKAQNPSCQSPVLDRATKQVKIACFTSKVYPSAGCQFFHSPNKVNFTLVNGDVTYSNTTLNETPVYFKTQCVLSASLDILRFDTNYFKVQMYPKLKGNEHFNTESNVVLITLDAVMEETVSSALTVSYLHDKDLYFKLTIGLGAAAVVLLCISLILCALVISYRRKPSLKNQGIHLTASSRRYDVCSLPEQYQSTHVYRQMSITEAAIYYNVDQATNQNAQIVQTDPNSKADIKEPEPNLTNADTIYSVLIDEPRGDDKKTESIYANEFGNSEEKRSTSIQA